MITLKFVFVLVMLLLNVSCFGATIQTYPPEVYTSDGKLREGFYYKDGPVIVPPVPIIHNPDLVFVCRTCRPTKTKSKETK